MTEKAKQFVDEQIAISKALYDKRLNNESYIQERVKQITDLTTRIARKSVELVESGKSKDELMALKEETMNEEIDNQLEIMRGMFEEDVESRRERMKILSSFDLEDFKEANFELVREEIKLVAHFNDFIMNKAQNSVYAALDALEEELMEDGCGCENEDCDCNDHFRIFPINPDQTVN